jgi:peptidylprolyl isomerase
MSKLALDPEPGRSAMTKREKHRAARAAKARAAAVAEQRRLMRNVLVAVAALVAIGLLTFWVTRPSADTQAQASSSPSGPAPQAALDPALQSKPVVETPTGTVTTVKVTTLIEGKGEAATAGRQLTVNYVGVSFKDGKEFDSSWKTGGQPFSLILGAGNVIKGWDEGLVGVRQGSRVQIDIPADKAYGQSAPDGYPAGALRFVVDVLSVSDPNT